MAQAQLEEDVKLYSEGKLNIKGFYKLGGAIFDELEIIESVTNSLKEV